MKALVLPIALPRSLVFPLSLALGFLSFAVPFSLGHSQFLTGSIVNAALFSSAILLPGKYFLPIVILPSLAVLSRGIIFGPFTLFLIYFLPFIWLGNLVLIWIFKKTYPRFGYVIGILSSAFAKQVLLYLSASFYLQLKMVPKIFLATMGMNQFLTAITGGLLVYLIFRKFPHEPANS